jgi:hypothetical protein
VEGRHSRVLPIFAQRIEERDGELAELFVGREDNQGFHAALLRVNKAGDYSGQSPRTRDAVLQVVLGVVDATADHSAVAVSLEIAAMMGACDCGHDLAS